LRFQFRSGLLAGDLAQLVRESNADAALRAFAIIPLVFALDLQLLADHPRAEIRAEYVDENFGIRCAYVERLLLRRLPKIDIDPMFGGLWRADVDARNSGPKDEKLRHFRRPSSRRADFSQRLVHLAPVHEPQFLLALQGSLDLLFLFTESCLTEDSGGRRGD